MGSGADQFPAPQGLRPAQTANPGINLREIREHVLIVFHVGQTC